MLFLSTRLVPLRVDDVKSFLLRGSPDSNLCSSVLFCFRPNPTLSRPSRRSTRHLPFTCLYRFARPPVPSVCIFGPEGPLSFDVHSTSVGARPSVLSMSFSPYSRRLLSPGTGAPPRRSLFLGPTVRQDLPRSSRSLSFLRRPRGDNWSPGAELGVDEGGRDTRGSTWVIRSETVVDDRGRPRRRDPVVVLSYVQSRKG